MAKRTITKVKHHDGKTTVEWTDPNGKHLESTTLTDCPDPPKKSFLEALAAVEQEVVRRIGIQGKSFSAAFSLTGVTVSTNIHGHRQFKPSGYLRCGYGGGTGMSLPLLREKVDDEGGDSVLSDVALKRFEKLLSEALAYSKQDRQQTSLGLDGTGTE